MTEVIHNLFIGNWQEARASIGFYVITVASDSPFVGAEHFKLVDGPGNSLEDLKAAATATFKAHSRGGRALVHCVGGRSRSAAVMVLALSQIRSCNICAAYDFLISKHDITRIHPFVSGLLLKAEATLGFKANTPDFVAWHG